MFPNANQPQPILPSYPSPAGPNRKVIILGLIGGIILVIIVIILLFSGGSKNSNQLKADLGKLVNSQGQLIAISSQYQNNIASSDLLNAVSTSQITWQSSLNDTLSYYNALSKKPANPSNQVDAKTKQNLDSAQQAGNLDPALASSLLSTANQIKAEAASIAKDQPSAKLKSQLISVNDLADTTIKQISPFADSN